MLSARHILAPSPCAAYTHRPWTLFHSAFRNCGACKCQVVSTSLKSVTLPSAPLKCFEHLVCLYEQWKQTFLGCAVSTAGYLSPSLEASFSPRGEMCDGAVKGRNLRYWASVMPKGLMVLGSHLNTWSLSFPSEKLWQLFTQHLMVFPLWISESSSYDCASSLGWLWNFYPPNCDIFKSERVCKYWLYWDYA